MAGGQSVPIWVVVVVLVTGNLDQETHNAASLWYVLTMGMPWHGVPVPDTSDV